MRRILGITSGLGLLVLLVGCGDVPDRTGPELAPVEASAAVAANQVVERVSGSASFTAPDGDLRTFAFTALRRQDGTVTGQWQRVRRFDGNASDAKAHGVVTCFHVIHNRVWLGGYATVGRFSEPPFNEVAWQVVDNGQGRNAPPDQISLQWPGRGPGFAGRYCETQPDDLVLFDIPAGSVMIR